MKYPKHRQHCVALALGLLLAISASIFATPKAHARDMQGRLGLGYNAQFANYYQPGGVPGVSLKYGLTRDIATELVVAVSTGTPTNSATALKLFKNLFYETSLNFYFMVGAGIVAANSRSGAEFIGGFGAEFFIPGIESLGFSMETGATFNNLGGNFALQTMGVSFLNAGIHFYF
jgi:hypothetical protein